MDQEKIQATPHPERVVAVSPETSNKTSFPSEEGILDVAPPRTFVADVQAFLREIAGQIGEEPGQITVHHDLSNLLERMKDGVTVQLSLSRPRFLKKLSLEDLGLKINLDLATSEEAMRVLLDYFQFGRRSLLPKVWQDKLQNSENSARYCLKRHSLKSHWGAFVPVREYQDWKEENAKQEQEFWNIQKELLAQYDTVCEEVLTDFRVLAEDSWRRVLIGSVLKDPSTIEQAVMSQLLQRLHVEEGKAAFLDAYLATIRRALPSRLEIEESFRYTVEIGVIPLPSLLAQDIEQADSVYQERALRDARVRAEMDRMERERFEAMLDLSAKEQVEHERRYFQLQAEQETIRLGQQMERDVLANAKAEKERLVREFYASVVLQINQLVSDVTNNVLESLEEHSGIIRGPVSSQLRNLVNQLSRMNFMNDVELMQQIEQIQSIIPTDTERDQARRGLARIDTGLMQRVVRQVHERANEILLNLDSATGPRRTRKIESIPDGNHLMDVSGARKVRPEAPGLTPPKTQSMPRRTRSKK